MAIDLTPLFKARGLYEQMDWNQLNQLAQGFGLGYSREVATTALTEARRREAQAIRDREKEVYRSNVAALENVLPGTQTPVSTLGSFIPNAPERPFARAKIVLPEPPALGLDIPNYAPDLTLDPFGNAVAPPPFGDGVGDSGVGAAQEYINRPLELGAPTSDTYTLANSLMSQYGYSPAWQEEQKLAAAQEQKDRELDLTEQQMMSNTEIARLKAERETGMKQREIQSDLDKQWRAVPNQSQSAVQQWQSAIESGKFAEAQKAYAKDPDNLTSEQSNALAQGRAFLSSLISQTGGANVTPSEEMRAYGKYMTPEGNAAYRDEIDKAIAKSSGLKQVTKEIVSLAKSDSAIFNALPAVLQKAITNGTATAALMMTPAGDALYMVANESMQKKFDNEVQRINDKIAYKYIVPELLREDAQATFGDELDLYKQTSMYQKEATATATQNAPTGYYGFDTKPADAPDNVDGDPIVAWITVNGQPQALTASGGRYPWE
jgi:hypothetical protein